MVDEYQIKYCPHCGAMELVYDNKHNTYLCVNCYFHFEVTEVFYV